MKAAKARKKIEIKVVVNMVCLEWERTVPLV